MPVPELSPSTVQAETVLRQLELTVTRRLSGLLHGDFQGLLPGTGVEPSDTRLYEMGDDVRRIDWAATARSGVTQLRTTVEDRDLSVYLLADASGSMDFGTAATSKRFLAAAALASFGFLASRGTNRVGGGVADAAGWRWLRPAPGRTVLRLLLVDFLASVAPGPVDLPEMLRLLDRSASRRGLVVVVSDFAGLDPQALKGPLSALAVRHELVVVEIVDPRELALTDVGVVSFVDPETGFERWVDTSSSDVREKFATRAARHRTELAEVFAASGAQHMVLSTGSDWLVDLVAWLRLRRFLARTTGGRRT